MEQTHQLQASITAGGATFSVRFDGANYRVFSPDGTPTEIARSSIEEARRALIHNGPGLVAEWIARQHQ